MKVYLHYWDAQQVEKMGKISIPKSWVETKDVNAVIALVLKAYNEKNVENQIVPEESHLETPEGEKIFSDAICGTVLADHADYHVKVGVWVKASMAAAVSTVDDGKKLKCKHYGCNMPYYEEENHDEACQYHSGPPVFHDTQKYWSCCKERKVYDFEEFQSLKGCCKGRHSNVNMGSLISASPNAPTNLPILPVTTTEPVLKSIADFNISNPTAASSEAAAAKIATATRKSTRSTDGLTARCQRKGCQKTVNVADNSATACSYHAGQPIFHDALKFWGCCPNKKCTDFDAFLAVPGCATGFHDDGVIDL